MSDFRVLTDAAPLKRSPADGRDTEKTDFRVLTDAAPLKQSSRSGHEPGGCYFRVLTDAAPLKRAILLSSRTRSTLPRPHRRGPIEASSTSYHAHTDVATSASSPTRPH